jgi:hypothetical protein
MGNDPGTEITTEFAKELAKQFPVKEAFSPPARQAGQILEDIVKTIQLALVPFQVAGALQDRLRHFIDRSIRAVPEEHRVSPPPQILGPVIEAIRNEPADSEIDHMFSELLSASMDRSRVKDAHPAFIGIIKSLSSDEAKILKSMVVRPVLQVTRQKYTRATNLFDPAIYEQLKLPPDLAYPGDGRVYLQHLTQLGLIETSMLRASEPIKDAAGHQTGIRNFVEHRLTEWGRQFMRAASQDSRHKSP